MKKIKFGIFVIAIVLFASIISLTIISKEMNKYTTVKSFHDISEFYRMDEFATKKLSTENDEYYKNQNIEETYMVKICFDKTNYEIYAYEFKNFDEANYYYYGVTGVKLQNTSQHYKINTNSIKSDMIVLNEEKVYRIEGKGIKAFVNFRKYLDTMLTVKIRD